MSKKITVLDHGFVELVDHMGADQAIVDAARVSIAGENVKPTSQNRGLIRYLMRKRHTSPFEQVEFKFRAKMPIFVARQWIRHRTASLNEISARYGELPEEFYVPEEKDVLVQADVNKQGRGDSVVPAAAAVRQEMQQRAASEFAAYHTWLDAGVARELARINLPLSAYTSWIWKIDLHNLFHFLSLRMDSHAQYEIRVYAEAMAELIKPIVPLAWEAFEDYRLGGMFLSRLDTLAVSLMLDGADPNSGEIEQLFPTKREYSEFLDKWKILVSKEQ